MNNNGLLSTRTNALLDQNTTRDNLGRIKNQQTTLIKNITVLTEALTWRANTTPQSYETQDTRKIPQTRAFSYNARGQLLSEGAMNFQYDGNTEGTGLGVRTHAKQQIPPTFEEKVIDQDPWSRITKTFTTHGEFKTALTGSTQKVKTLKLILNNLNLGSINIPNPTEDPTPWNFPIALKPGAYTLKATAITTDGIEGILPLCAPADICKFEIGPQPRTHYPIYDQEGNLTKTTITNTTNNIIQTTQEFTWDPWNLLLKVTERDQGNTGYDWNAVYDAFGRRLKTTHTPVTAGALDTAKTQTVLSYFDPEVEFLEIGVKVDSNATTWKAYGPDKNGIHGGLNGIGGLEEIITPTKSYSIINNALGHVVATFDGNIFKPVLTEVGAYGPLPENLVLPLSSERGLEQVTHWQGRRMDPTGLYLIGMNYFNGETGTWIKPDPFGHAVNWSLYGFCDGNPISLCDPTGRYGKPLLTEAKTQAANVYYSVADTAINVVPGGISMLSSAMGYGMDMMGMPHHLHAQANLINQSLSPYARSGFYNPNSLTSNFVAVGSAVAMPAAGIRPFQTRLFTQPTVVAVPIRTAKGLTPEIRAIAEANITGSGRTVLGHYPGYIEKAQRTGASYFDMGDAWNSLMPVQRTSANMHFLDKITDAGNRVYLSLPKNKIRPSSALADEVQYLTKERGYQWINQWSLRPPGN